MRKRLLSMLLILAMIFSMLSIISVAASASNYSGTCGENVSWELDTDTSILKILGSGAMTNFWSYEDSPWYSYHNSIKAVTIGADVTSIGDYAFYDCTSLTSVTIPDSVTSIGNLSFYGCNSLTSVTISSSVTSISANTFSGCSRLTGIWVSSENEHYCSDAGGVLFNKDKTTLVRAPGAYSGAYVIPNSVTGIGDSAFDWCTGLTSITIPDSVISIGSNAFSHCSSLTSVTIGDGVTSIDDWSFYGCNSLTNVTISNSVATIGTGAFYECRNLKSIIIGPGVTKIGECAFQYCSNLVEVYIMDVAAWCNIDFNDDYYSCSNPLHNGAGLYLNGMLVENLVIPDSVTKIRYAAFSGCSSLKSVTIPHVVTTIGSRAFIDCRNLEEVSIPYGITTIEGYAFSNCRNLKDVKIPDSVISIDELAFYNCSSLNSVTIPKNVTTIGGQAFGSCDNLTSITIMDGVTTIGDRVFTECYKLNSVIIPESVTSFGKEAFYNCQKLKSVTIPGGVTNIGEGAFSYCNSLRHVHFLGDMPAVGYQAFYACSSNLRFCYMKETTGWEKCSYPTELWNYTRTGDCTNITYTCNTCGEVYSYTGDEAHDWGEGAVEAAPTCTEEGRVRFACTYCGEIRTESILPTGHNQVTEAAVAPSCAENGFTEGSYCTACGEVFSGREVVPALGHSLLHVEATPPTCMANGCNEHYACERCGKCYADAESLFEMPASYVIIAPLGHIEVIDKAVGATCATTGLTEGSHCDRCGEIIVAQNEVPMVGHNPVYVAAKTATCTQNGNKAYYACTACGKYFFDLEGVYEAPASYVVIAALGHTYETTTTEPTCTVDGQMDTLCSICGERITEIIPAFGHSFVEGNCVVCGTNNPNYEFTFVKVSAEQPDWSGSYVIGWDDGTNAYIFDGINNADGNNTTSAVADGKVTAPASSIIIIEKVDGGYTLKATGGYLNGKVASGVASNGLAFETTPSVATITWENGNPIITSAIGTIFRYNNGLQYGSTTEYSSWFRFYKTTSSVQTPVSLYKLDDGSNPGGNDPVDPPAPPAPSGEDFVLSTEIKAGDEVIIVCAAKNIALSANYPGNSFYNEGIAVTPVDGKIANPDAAIVWTVGEDGEFYTFANNGQKIGMGTEFTTMTLGAVNYKWQVSEAATEGAFYIANLDRDPAKAYYMQWFESKGYWSGYHTITEEFFAMNFYVKGAEAEEVCNHSWGKGNVTVEPTCTEDGETTYTCAFCGATKTEIIAANGHNYVDGTCTGCSAAEPVPSEYTIATSLKVGDQIIITVNNNGAHYAMAADGDTVKNALNAVAVTVNGSAMDIGSAKKVIWTVCAGSVDGKYTLKSEDGQYISYSGIGTALSLDDTGADYELICGEGTSKIAYGADSNGTVRSIFFRDSTGVPQFRCYAEKNASSAGYSAIMTVWKVGYGLESALDENLTFGAQLYLENDLTMAFRVKTDKLAAYDISTAYLVVERDIYETSAAQATVETMTINEYKIENGRLIFSYPGIAAAQMNDSIRATLYVKNAEGKEFVSPVQETSVATYLDGLIRGSASDTKLVTLIMDMVNYGAAAQVYFDRHADAPVNEAYDSFKTYASYASADFRTALENLSATENAEGKSGKLNLGLDLGTRIGIQYKVTVPVGIAAEDVSLIVTDAKGNTLETLTLTGEGVTTDAKGRYIVNFYGSTSKDMRRVVYATAYANGEAITGTYAYSISSYAWGVQENAGTQPADLVNVTRAMLLYGDSASAYFG